MHDARLMSGREALGDLTSDVQELARRQRPGGEEVRQGPAFDELHDHVGRGVLLADVVDGDDVGIVEGRGRPRLAFESRQVRAVRGQLRREHLDRDAAVQPRVPRRVNLPHSACAEWRQDFVGAETPSCCESHAAAADSIAADATVAPRSSDTGNPSGRLVSRRGRGDGRSAQDTSRLAGEPGQLGEGGLELLLLAGAERVDVLPHGLAFRRHLDRAAGSSTRR